MTIKHVGQFGQHLEVPKLWCLVGEQEKQLWFIIMVVDPGQRVCVCGGVKCITTNTKRLESHYFFSLQFKVFSLFYKKLS